MATAKEGEVAFMPRLLLFVRDEFAGGEYPAGYRNVAVGLQWHDGSCVTMQDGAPGGPPNVALWFNVEAAVDALDAYVCGFTPSRRLDDATSTPPVATAVDVVGIHERLEKLSAEMQQLVAEAQGSAPEPADAERGSVDG